jgi:hypothetical protein
LGHGLGGGAAGVESMNMLCPQCSPVLPRSRRWEAAEAEIGAQREEIVRDRGMIRSQQTEIAGQRSRVEQLEARVARLEAVINRR